MARRRALAEEIVVDGGPLDQYLEGAGADPSTAYVLLFGSTVTGFSSKEKGKCLSEESDLDLMVFARRPDGSKWRIHDGPNPVFEYGGVQVEVIGGRVEDRVDGNLLAQLGLDPLEYDATRSTPADSILLRRPSSTVKTTAAIRGGGGKRSPVSDEEAGHLPTAANFTDLPQIDSEQDTSQLLLDLQKSLNERLETGDPIGSGGMGTVFSATDRALRNRVAKKVLHPRLTSSKRGLFLFVREARITAQLDHPHIVPVHNLGLDADNRPYFTMKQVQGAPLAKLLSRIPKTDLQRQHLTELLSVLLKVCDALAFAHSRGVLHCDIKPSNIMVGEYGEVYLMDWGIARVMDDSIPDVAPLQGIAETSIGLTSGLAMGTPSYMSTEQAIGDRKSLDERADVFALGAILYEALAGCPPHDGNSYEEVLAKAREGKIRPPGLVHGFSLPPVLQYIAMKAMHPDRQHRYRTVRHFQEELQRYLYVARDFPTAIYQAKEHIIREGEAGHSVYIVESGRCHAYRKRGGKSVVLGTLGPGDVFGETAVLADIPRTASVVADETTRLHVVTREVLETELDDIKPWIARLVRALASRFRDERSRKLLMDIETGP
jgi:serine/threonine-protein kinase